MFKQCSAAQKTLGDSWSQVLIIWVRQVLSCSTVSSCRAGLIVLPPANFSAGLQLAHLSQSYVCSGHTLMKLILILCCDKFSENTRLFPLNVTSHRIHVQLWWFSVLKTNHTEGLSAINAFCCSVLGTTESCHLHYTPLSNMTNSACGQKTKCVIKYLTGHQTICPALTHCFCTVFLRKSSAALGAPPLPEHSIALRSWPINTQTCLWLNVQGFNEYNIDFVQGNNNMWPIGAKHPLNEIVKEELENSVCNYFFGNLCVSSHTYC